MHSMGPPDWRCPWDQQGPANNLPDCWGSLSRCPARRNGDWRGGRRLRPSSSEESSWNRWCRPVGRKEKALFPALLSFQRCYSKKYWGLLGLQETTAPTGQAKRRLVRLHDVYILKVSLLRGWMFKAMRGSFVWNPVIHFHNTGKLMFAGQCLGIKSQAAKNVAVCPWGWFTSKTLQACSVLLRIQGCAMYQPTFSGSFDSFFTCKGQWHVKNNQISYQDLDQRTSTLLFRDSRGHPMSVSLLLLLLFKFFLPFALLSLPVLLSRGMLCRAARLLDGRCCLACHIVVL